MAVFKLSINLDNAAYEDGWQYQLSDILKGLVYRLCDDDVPDGGTVRDINGNKVGRWIVEF